MVSPLCQTSTASKNDASATSSLYKTDDACVSAHSRETLYAILFGQSFGRRVNSRQELEAELEKLCSSEKGSAPLKLRAAYELGVRVSMAYSCAPELSSPHSVEDFCAQRMQGYDQEHFVLLCLNAKNMLLQESELSVGTLDKTIVGVRDVVKRALLASARSVILVHNHPSGDPHPSNADVVLTKRIEQACELFDICVLDHVILGSEGRSYSLRSYGDM